MNSRSPNRPSTTGSKSDTRHARREAICARCHINVEPYETGGYLARVQEMPGVFSLKETPEEARLTCEGSLRFTVGVLLEDGVQPPESLEPRTA